MDSTDRPEIQRARFIQKDVRKEVVRYEEAVFKPDSNEIIVSSDDDREGSGPKSRATVAFEISPKSARTHGTESVYSNKKKKRRKRKFPRGKLFPGHAKEINEPHEQYLLTVGMMFGIRVAVGRSDSVRDTVVKTSRISLEDFMSVDKYVFLPEGNSRPPNPTPPHGLGSTFKFKDYAPKIFREIRRKFGIDSASYMLSLAGNAPYLEFVSNSKSGQFFFYSHDGKYMIKTQTPDENKFLRRMLPHYFQHLMNNKNTLLTRFYGMHRVKMHDLGKKIHFVIMGSVFATNKPIHSIYDLKGSTVNRYESRKTRPKKDLNLKKENRKLHLGQKRGDFLRIIEKDAAFLAKMKVMDYSLLVGIYSVQEAKRSHMQRENSCDEPSGPETGSEQESAREKPKSLSATLLKSISGLHLVPGRRKRRTKTRHTSAANRMTPTGDGRRHDQDEELQLSSSEIEGAWDDDDEWESEGELSVCDVDFEPDEYVLSTTRSSDARLWNGSVNEALGTPIRTDHVEGRYLIQRPRRHGASYFVHSLSRRKDMGIVSSHPDESMREIYYLGIIDILQQYNMLKNTETIFKSLANNLNEISAIHPKAYAQRFVQFMEENTV